MSDDTNTEQSHVSAGGRMQRFVIPRAGDIWEFKMPGKRKMVKEIERVSMVWMSRKGYSDVRKPYANWKRLPKGRYSGLRIKWLLKNGRRVSTKAERDAAFKARIEERKAERRAV